MKGVKVTTTTTTTNIILQMYLDSENTGSRKQKEGLQSQYFDNHW